MVPRHVFPRAVLLTVLFTLLAACGGGGGGGGDAPKPTPGGFTISTTAVSFTVRQGKAVPAAQHVTVQLTDNSTAAFGAAYVAPQQPVSWLTPSVTGSAPSYDLALSVNNTSQSLGTQVVTLTVGTADSSGTILQTKTIQITLNVQAPVSSTATQISAPGFVLGASASTQTFSVPVKADVSTTWKVMPNQSWITVPATSQTGDGTANITVDSRNLDVGTANGSITIVNTMDSSDNIVIPVTTQVTLPTLTVSPSSIIIGGADGADMVTNAPLQVSVSTGTNQYPWTATLSMGTGSGWLGMNVNSGAASATSSTVTVIGNRNAVVPGTYTGSVRIDLTIGTHVLTQTIPVTLNKEGHWINVSSTGAAFSQFPSRSVLTRNIQVVSSLGRTDVPWTAVSDKSWLTVTPSGVTGGMITLTANPAGQPVDQPLVAEVLVKSSDGSVINEETIRVGLWVGNTDPTDFSYTSAQNFVVANPVEPYVYANSTGTDVSVYNVYSGALVNTLHSVVARAGSMTMSTDGTLLFVSDDTNHRIVELDAATGAELQRFPWASSSSIGVAYARPSAQPILMLGDGSVFDVGTGESYGHPIGAGWYGGVVSFGVDGLSRYVYTQNQGLSPSTLTQYSLKYTALGSDPMVISINGSSSGGSNGRDICASVDGSRVYTANGAPYEFWAFNSDGMANIQTLPAQPYPNNAACGWNGLFVGGIQFSYSPDNVWVYRPDGTKVTSFNLHSGGVVSGLLPDTLVLSGDNTRVIGSTDTPTFQFRNLPPP